MSGLNLISFAGLFVLSALAWAVGGISALVPARRNDLASLAFRALAGATLATLLTGAAAGLFYHGQQGLLGL